MNVKKTKSSKKIILKITMSMTNTSESLEGLKASRHVIPHVRDNRSLLPLCSDARWGYPQVCVKAGVYQQQGNCLSAPPLGDLSLFLGMISISIVTIIWCPFTTPMSPLSFMLLSFIRTVILKLCILLCCADCAMIPLSLSWTFPLQTMPLFFHRFVPTLL